MSYSGAGVGIIKNIISVKDVIVGTQREVKDIINGLSSVL
jgi:hypothetical protein